MKMTNIIPTYIYNGLGFPIELHDVEMELHDGELYPKIDVRKVADMAIKSLLFQESKLNGNQIKFIRTYFSKTLREFSMIIGETPSTIKEWENFSNRPINMKLGDEILLRSFIFNTLLSKILKG
jgi:DNA-binding transcriptional regulator YiaG